MNRELLRIAGQWNATYHEKLLAAFMATDTELINDTFTLNPNLGNMVSNVVRGFREEFSELMLQWILGGKKTITPAMIELNPNAAKFATTFDVGNGVEICTAYGPRFHSQMSYVIRELERFPDSRRANIMMLDAKDRLVADAMAEGKTKCEYLCTHGFNFRLREGRLDMHTSMRSNNYTSTVCQDIYVFFGIHKFMADKMGVPVGLYTHHATSGHILPHEREWATKILCNYFIQQGAMDTVRDIIARADEVFKIDLEGLTL